MDREGIDVQVLSLTSPGIQSMTDPKAAATSAQAGERQPWPGWWRPILAGSWPWPALPWIRP